MARIAAATVTTNKTTGRKVLKTVDKTPAHFKIARNKKADRAEADWLASTSDAFRFGATANAAGKSLDDCPYDGRTTNAKQWRAGWTKAFSEVRKAARKAKAA